MQNFVILKNPTKSNQIKKNQPLLVKIKFYREMDKWILFIR